MNYTWLKEVKDTTVLPDEYQEIIDLIGLDNFIKLLNEFDKSAVYISGKKLLPLLIQFIKQNKEIPTKKIARMLNLSTRYIYKLRNSG